MRGDPQRAVEEYGIDDYLPIECISVVEIQLLDKFDNEWWFRVKKHNQLNPNYKNIPLFFDFFELMEESKNVEKYNL